VPAQGKRLTLFHPQAQATKYRYQSSTCQGMRAAMKNMLIQSALD
jgi:hypothetical protein